MKVYQVSKKMFFVSNGVDYAAAVDMNDDVKIFTSRKKAEKEFKELVNSYAAVYKAEPKVVNLIGTICWTTVIKNYDTRIVIELLTKDTL